jgi:hypothetical protein
MARIAGAVVGLLAIAAVASAHGSGGASRATPYSLVGRQAQEVAATIRFVNAFNAHHVQEALPRFAPGAIGSDCDYRHVRVVLFEGKREIEAWLRRRFADADHFGIGRVFNENAGQPSGVLGIDWSIRRSKTLRRLGFRHGVVPQLSAKVVFTKESPPRIRAFANGPGGADPSLCRPK